MKTGSNVDAKKASKYFKLYLFILPIIAIFLVLGREIDNDFYFLYPTGEYILNNGFPTKDFLTWHGDMDIIVQQWLSAVLFYLIGSKLNIIGLYLLKVVCALGLYILSYKTCRLISNNFTVSVICSGVSVAVISLAFITTRPQIFTYLFLMAELYLLESYIKTQKVLPLFFLPLISLALINFHSSMWPMMFIFMAPYIANALPINIKKIRQQACCRLVPLLVAVAVCFAVGFINPYGFKAMVYFFYSYGYSTINSSIMEMVPISINDYAGKIVFVSVFVGFAMVYFYKKGKFESRYVLMFLGTLCLGLLSVKSLPYYLIGLMLFCSSYFKDVRINISQAKESNKKPLGFKKVGAVVLAAAVIAGGVLFYTIGLDTENANETVVADEKPETEQLDIIIDYLNNENADDMRLFNEFNSGPYLEYKGIKPFMDARAELFFEKNNHEFDYYDELYAAEHGSIYYKDYFDKYDFTHLIINKSTPIFYIALANDDDYTEVISENEYSLFIKK